VDPRIIDGDDEWVVETARDRGLTLEARKGLSRLLADGVEEKLDRHQAPRHRVFPSVDGAEAALADLLLDEEAIQ
jgi:hypothetical protein